MKFVYASISEKSKNELESLIPYKYNTKKGLYITIDWDCDYKKYIHILGRRISLTVDQIKFDDKIEAIPIKFDDDIKCVNKYPHITWSHVDSIDAYYSNYMLYTSNKSVKFKKTRIDLVIERGEF